MVGGVAKIIVMIHHLLCLQPSYSLLNAISSHHLNSQMPSYTCFLNFSGQCRQERDAVVKLKLSIFLKYRFHRKYRYITSAYTKYTHSVHLECMPQQLDSISNTPFFLKFKLYGCDQSCIQIHLGV